ncbi:MAG TPA: DHA2 family efflux MFS transporter permease subunit [Deltaproteobacteria bacterium]|nr:DHA2 family efflux MFS transporter permease subunit [Deltaproteobacteria bacterium]
MERPAANKWIIALSVMLPTLMVIVDTSVVNVSLDHIRGSLSAGIDEATWSISAYLSANAVIIPMSGWLSRLMGRKRYLIITIGLFTLSSLLCGMAWNIQSLVFFRILQGLAGGGLQPASQAILLESFPPYQHGMAMAIFGVGMMFGPIMGPVMGGWITDNWSWHWIFFVNVPIGIVSLFMVMVFITDPHYLKRIKMKIDYLGLVFLGLGIGCLQMVLDRGRGKDWFSSEFIVWMSVIAVCALIFFVLVEKYAEHAIVELKAFRDISFSLGNVIIFFIMFNLFGSIVLLPIYLQKLMGYTALQSGIVLAPGGIASLFMLPVIGALVNRINPKLLTSIGVLITGYSAYMMSLFSQQADFMTVLWPRVVMGLGLGMTMVPHMTLTLSHIPKQEMGNASSIFNLLRNLGGSFGVAVPTTVLAHRAQFHQVRLTEHLTQFDPGLRESMHALAQNLQAKGFDPSLIQAKGLGMIYQKVLNESYMMAFNDVFLMLAFTTFLMLLLIVFMKRVDHSNNRGH